MEAHRILLALGARDPRAERLISGTARGRFTTGALQQLVYLAGFKPARARDRRAEWCRYPICYSATPDPAAGDVGDRRSSGYGAGGWSHGRIGTRIMTPRA